MTQISEEIARLNLILEPVRQQPLWDLESRRLVDLGLPSDYIEFLNIGAAYDCGLFRLFGLLAPSSPYDVRWINHAMRVSLGLPPNFLVIASDSARDYYLLRRDRPECPIVRVHEHWLSAEEDITVHGEVAAPTFSSLLESFRANYELLVRELASEQDEQV